MLIDNDKCKYTYTKLLASELSPGKNIVKEESGKTTPSKL